MTRMAHRGRRGGAASRLSGAAAAQLKQAPSVAVDAGEEGVTAPRPENTMPTVAAPPSPPGVLHGNIVASAAATERHPDIFMKTKLCKFHLLGSCTKGTDCQFAHSQTEMQPLPDLFRTKLCKTLINTGSCTDSTCTYAHNKSELRLVQIIGGRSRRRRAGTGIPQQAAAPPQLAAADAAAGGSAATMQPSDARSPPHENSMTYVMQDEHGVRMIFGQQQVSSNKPPQCLNLWELSGCNSSYPPQKTLAVQHSICDGGAATLQRDSLVNPQQEPRKSQDELRKPDNSSSSSDGEFAGRAEPSENSTITPPPEHIYYDGQERVHSANSGPDTAKDADLGDFFDDVCYSMTVKNTFLEFQPAMPHKGLRTVHTAAGRLDLMCQDSDSERAW